MVSCPYCDNSAAGRVLWANPQARVLLIEDAPFIGLCRVVWNAHVKELTDLGQSDRSFMMQVVCGVEEGLRRLLSPDKINLASLGNQVPHLHWHVIPRFADDTHYPEAIWTPARRPPSGRTPPADLAVALSGFLKDRLTPAAAGGTGDG